MTAWSFVIYLLSPCFLWHLLWRGIRYPAYWRRWHERFGYLRPLTGHRVIWVHAVSVGEVRSSAALISRLMELYPEHRILVTTMTPTGSEQVEDLFGNAVSHAYVPYDFPGCVRRFMARVNPEFAVIAETEFWPNLFAACAQRAIPLLLVNVRLSQASLTGYLWVPKTARAMLANADLICAQSRSDEHRLKTLGVDDALIHVTGNLKFDAPVPTDVLGAKAAPCSSPVALTRVRSANCSGRLRSFVAASPICCSSSCRGTRNASARLPGCAGTPVTASFAEADTVKC